MDLVVDAIDNNKGGVRAVIAPNWVAQQQVHVQERVRISIEKMIKTMKEAGLRVSGKETIEQFVARRTSEAAAGKTKNLTIDEVAQNIKDLVSVSAGRVRSCFTHYQKASPVTK